MFGIVTKKRLVRELRDQRFHYEWQVKAERDRAALLAEELEELRGWVSDTINLHAGRPYRSNAIGLVTFPVSFSTFALRELSKGMPSDVIVRLVGERTMDLVAKVLADSQFRLPERDLRELGHE